MRKPKPKPPALPALLRQHTFHVKVPVIERYYSLLQMVTMRLNKTKGWRKLEFETVRVIKAEAARRKFTPSTTPWIMAQNFYQHKPTSTQRYDRYRKVVDDHESKIETIRREIEQAFTPQEIQELAGILEKERLLPRHEPKATL